jgi:hypothetical protein
MDVMLASRWPVSWSPTTPEVQAMAEARYRDRWIECTDDELLVHGYYFPWGTKHIRYSDIRSARRVDLSAFRGRGRIWGTANPRYWASLDPRRPGKRSGLVLDLGRSVRPFLTPDDTDAVLAEITAHSAAGTVVDDARGPIL